jgi:hypothetical protein
MPAEFAIHRQWGVVVSRGSGVFTQADFLDHMSRMRADPEFNPDLHQIVDCRAITKMDLTSGQIESLASRSIFSARSRRAFVVSSDMQYGLARMFATYREMQAGQEVMVFQEMSDALAWLGLPTDFITPTPAEARPDALSAQ